MALQEMLKVGNSYNKAVKEFWVDSVAEVANLPTNVPAGSICYCQVAPVAPATKSTLKVYMFYETANNPTTGVWYEI